MTCGRATGSAPITAARAALGCRPAAGLAAFLTAALRGVLALALAAALGLATFLAAFLAAAPVLAARAAPVFEATAALVKGVAAVLRGGNLLGANSKFTLPASASQASMALKPRRVRMETNLSSKSVLPVASSLRICSRSIGCCRMIWPVLKSQLGVAWAIVGTDFSQT